MTHGHEVLAMMQGHSYTEKSLLEAIIEKFGAEDRFYTCSAENLTAQGLIDFLKEHGKFCRWMPASRSTPARSAKTRDNKNENR